MIKNVVEHIGGIGLYGIISVSLFFAFFIGMLIWAFRLKKSYLDAMRELPLEGGEVAPENHHQRNQNSDLP